MLAFSGILIFGAFSLCVKRQTLSPTNSDPGMKREEFRKAGYEMIDYICNYYETIENRPILSTVSPGYLSKLLPTDAPNDPEEWKSIMSDVDSKIMPGITHWQHPSFFAYFPANVSYPGLLGEMMSGMFNVIGFSWITSPACTELETIVLDWLAKALNLPSEFQSSGKGGGVIQSTASESVLVCLVAAKAGRDKCVAYISDQTHSSVQKACMIAGVDKRIVESNDDCQFDAERLELQIQDDLAKGLTPCFVVCTIGTTSTGAVDSLKDLGKICSKYSIWLHVDAAYTGSTWICPEFRRGMDGIEYADSFNFNPHKMMLVNFDCSTLWVKNRVSLLNALDITPVYLRNKASESGLVIDYRSWQIPLGRRFKSLKLWFVLRSYGIRGIQEYIRNVWMDSLICSILQWQKWQKRCCRVIQG